MESPPKSKAHGIVEHTAPERLGKYRLLSVIGKGSMGVVYKSFDPHIKRPVALKTIRQDLLDDDIENFPARFRIEAQAAGGLSHPGIVAVYEYGEEGGYAYLAMEYVDGRSLRECFEEKVRFSVEQVINIQSQLLNALQYAHDRGVWHRDIKPANILITGNGQVKVTDFGIARIETPRLTQAGSIMGTPGFIAPEMYLTDTFDHRIDVFAAGVVLYQLLADAPPFTGTPEKIMLKVCHETPLPPSVAGRQPAIRPFDTVVLQALARRPEERLPSAARFLDVLLHAQAHSGDAAGADETIIGRRPLGSGAASASVSQPPPERGAAFAPVGEGPCEPSVATASVGQPPSEPSAASTPIRQPPPESGAPSGPTSEPPSTDTDSSAHWDMEELGRIEARLALLVGPIAKVMVRRAARDTTDLASLIRWVAAKMTNLEDREQFLTGAGIAAASVTPPVRSNSEAQGSGGRPLGSAASAPRPLTAEDIARASRLLAGYVGPIALVLAKRAATGSSREEFIASLASHLSDEADRARFLRAVG